MAKQEENNPQGEQPQAATPPAEVTQPPQEPTQAPEPVVVEQSRITPWPLYTDEGEKRYFIVNKSGTVHEVPRDLAKECLKKPGYRMATKEEVYKYLGAPMQRSDQPIAAPWTPDPDTEPEVE